MTGTVRLWTSRSRVVPSTQASAPTTFAFISGQSSLRHSLQTGTASVANLSTNPWRATFVLQPRSTDSATSHSEFGSAAGLRQQTGWRKTLSRWKSASWNRSQLGLAHSFESSEPKQSEPPEDTGHRSQLPRLLHQRNQPPDTTMNVAELEFRNGAIGSTLTP